MLLATGLRVLANGTLCVGGLRGAVCASQVRLVLVGGCQPDRSRPERCESHQRRRWNVVEQAGAIVGVERIVDECGNVPATRALADSSGGQSRRGLMVCHSIVGRI